MLYEKLKIPFHTDGQNEISEDKEDKEASTRTGLVFAAKRSDGVLGAHMHRRMHQRGAV